MNENDIFDILRLLIKTIVSGGVLSAFCYYILKKLKVDKYINAHLLSKIIEEIVLKIIEKNPKMEKDDLKNEALRIALSVDAIKNTDKSVIERIIEAKINKYYGK